MKWGEGFQRVRQQTKVPRNPPPLRGTPFRKGGKYSQVQRGYVFFMSGCEKDTFSLCKGSTP